MMMMTMMIHNNNYNKKAIHMIEVEMDVEVVYACIYVRMSVCTYMLFI